MTARPKALAGDLVSDRNECACCGAILYERECRQCGGTFLTPVAGRFTCSPECQKARRRVKMAEANRRFRKRRKPSKGETS